MLLLSTKSVNCFLRNSPSQSKCSINIDSFVCCSATSSYFLNSRSTSDILSALPGTALAEALHTFTLDSGASRCFFCDSTTLTPLSTPVLVRLADPSGGLVPACSSTVLPCLAVLSDSLSGLHLPSFSTNLVSTAALQDAMVMTTTPGGQHVSICTCTRTGRHLATFTHRPGLSLYTLATKPPQVAASAQVSASGQVATPCSCRLLSHQTLLWHHRLGHPSLPRLRGMHSRLLVSGLPRSLPPLPPSPAPPCLPYVEGRKRAAPHSSFPPTSAPLQTLHMDVWGPARVSGQGCKRYFLLAVDDYTRYTTVFPLRSKGQDLLVLHLHSDRGGELSSDLLWDISRGEGILQSPTSGPVSPYRRPRPHCVGQGRLAMRRCSGSRDLVPLFAICQRTSSLPNIPCGFLGISLDAPGLQFYHPTLRHVFPSHNVTFDDSFPFYWLFPYRSAPPPPPPLFLAPGPPSVDPLPPPGSCSLSSGAAGGAAAGDAEYGGAEPGGVESEGAGSWGAEPGGSEPGGAEPEGVEPGGAETEGAEPRGAEPRGTASSGDTITGGARVTTGAGGTGGAAAAGPGGARTRGTGAAGTGGVGGAGVGDPMQPRVAGAGGAGAVGAKARGTSAGGAGAGGAGAVDPGAGGAGGTVRPQPYFVLTGGLTERLEPASRPASPVRTSRRVPHLRPPLVPGTRAMALRPSSIPIRVPLPPPPQSSLHAIPDPHSERVRAASPTVSRLLATAVTDPSFESTTMSALSANPPSVGGECALGTDVLEDRWEEFECLAAAVPRFASMLLAPEGDPDAPDIPTPRSYAEAITGPYSSLWQAAMDAEMGVDCFQTFSPTPKITTLWVLLHVAPQRDYELHSLDFSTAFLQGRLHEETWLRPQPGFTGSFPAVYGLHLAPREWHDTLRRKLAALGFTPSTADPSLILWTDTSLPLFYVLVYVDDLVFAIADIEALTLCEVGAAKETHLH
ncbi:unnamed protein product [Closterium sp. NIES-54]